MKMLFFCPLWGCEDEPFEDFARKVKVAGYDGVEMGFPCDAKQKNHLLQILKDEGLLLIAQHWQTQTSDFNSHKDEYEKHLRNLVDTGALFINSQTGKDFFSFEQNAELIELAKTISDESNVKIIHETHRGKFSFAAHIAMRFIESIEHLRIGLDISHWFCVAESMLVDQPGAIELALSRTEHIHARVGFAEGPQIPDPRADEWQQTLDRHIELWDQVIQRHRELKRDVFTITPEFGPFPYMTAQPFTRMPISDQWQINQYMKNLLAERYGH